MTPAKRRLFLSEIDDNAIRAVPWMFDIWALPHQKEPDGDWNTWVILGGRGAGKTRAGAEWVRDLVEGPTPLDKGNYSRIALVGETIDQTREVMVFGESGIIACSPPDRKPSWNATRRCLTWPNGAEAYVMSANNSEALRGPQFDAAWLDEFGFPAIDKGTNQPNVFVDPKSSESSYPYFSNGIHDPEIQDAGIKSILEYWNEPTNNPTSDVYNGSMLDVEKAFVWAWDARPWPDFPLRTNIWSDGDNYELGHWISGRMGGTELSHLVAEICEYSGVKSYDVSALSNLVTGFSISNIGPARSNLQDLMTAYDFHCYEEEGVLHFEYRSQTCSEYLDSADFIEADNSEQVFQINRISNVGTPDRLGLGFWNPDQDYQFSEIEALSPNIALPTISKVEVPLVLSNYQASKIAETLLSKQKAENETLSFSLAPSNTSLAVGDLFEFSDQFGNPKYRVFEIEEQGVRNILAKKVGANNNNIAPIESVRQTLKELVPANPVYGQLLNLPQLGGAADPVAPYFATTSAPWPDKVALYTSPGDGEFSFENNTVTPTVFGNTLDLFPTSIAHRWSNTSLRVQISSGSLYSASETQVFEGANTAIIRNGDEWEIIQFRNAELNPDGSYTLSNFLRGQMGTDAKIPNEYSVGSDLIFLDQSLQQLSLDQSQIGQGRYYRFGPAKYAYSDDSFTEVEFTANGVGLRPYSPVHPKVSKQYNGDIHLSWIRRSRVLGNYWAAFEIPLNEAFEKYEVVVFQQGQEVNRYEVGNTEFIYTTALQTVDGITTTTEFSIAQISETYGAGPAIRITNNV